MKKPKPPKPKHKKGLPPQLPEAPQKSEPESWFRFHVRAIVSHPYILAAGLLASFVSLIGIPLAVWGPFWPTIPKLHPSGDDFSLPFTVTNTNNWYSLRVIRFTCALEGTDPVNPKHIAAYNILVKDALLPPLGPGGFDNFSCVGAYPAGLQVHDAEMWVGVQYQVQWYGHKIGKMKGVADTFKFEYGKWVEGPIY
jgi:hypothetical protein